MNHPFLLNIIACLLFSLSNAIGNTQPASYMNEQKIIASESSDSLLPKSSMPELKAKKGKNNSISLEWSAENTSVIRDFDIQRSGDGTNFSKLSEWDSNSFKSKASYTFLDQRPLPVNYYRLKIVGVDGSYNYSKVVVVNQNGPFYSAVQPNPFVQSFTVDIYITDAQPIKIQLLNMNGSLLRYKSVVGKVGNNKIEFDDVGNLQPGIYMVRIVQGNSIAEKKIVKRN